MAIRCCPDDQTWCECRGGWPCVCEKEHIVRDGKRHHTAPRLEHKTTGPIPPQPRRKAKRRVARALTLGTLMEMVEAEMEGRSKL